MTPRHLMLASTSSVYGADTRQPFDEHHCCDQPLSLYAATKKAAEAIAYSHAHLCGLPITAMRLFTVYGPWGRPDMAIFKFTAGIIAGTPIEVYGEGKMTRDFTYVDDVVEAICRLTARVPAVAEPGAAAAAPAPYRVVNIGNGSPVGLKDFIAAIELAVGRKAVRRLMPMQPGDVPATFAGTAVLESLTGFRPKTSVADGVRAFVDWYRGYYRV